VLEHNCRQRQNRPDVKKKQRDRYTVHWGAHHDMSTANQRTSTLTTKN
jgi:hypothetical protein